MRREKPCTEPSECRSCGAAVLWVEWASSGKRMPVDERPDPAGKVVLTHRRAENRLVAEAYREPDHPGRRRFTSHFSTCPNAGEHRKGR